MFSTRSLREWRQMWANHGAASTVKAAFGRLKRSATPAATVLMESASASEIHPFDLQHGVETSGLIRGEDLTSGRRSDAWNTAYYGIAPSVFHAAMGSLPIDFARFTFCDIGSGKGRAVLLAMQYGFHAVWGIEVTPALHAVAVRNLKTYCPPNAPKGGVRLLNIDAAEFVFPPGPLVVFFYHPFCRPVLERVLRNLHSSLKRRPREAFVVYINPEVRRVLDAAPFLEKLSETTLELAIEDRLADRRSSSVEECAIYRSRL